MKDDTHRKIMAHVDVQFRPIQSSLRKQFNHDLREAQFQASRSGNSAAILPAEAKCYVTHAKALIVAKAKCIAEAYTTFGHAAGQQAARELFSFFSTIVAAWRSSFQGSVALRQMRTGYSTMQLVPLLQGFEREARAALDEAHAILDKQRVTIENTMSVHGTPVKYVIDTCVFNWLVDGVIKEESLPSDGGFAVTHIQVDEINKTSDEERRARLLLVQLHLKCDLIPTETLLFGRSRFGMAKLGEGMLFSKLKVELDQLNRRRKNNDQDALIAEVAIANGYTLLTADNDLRCVTERYGGHVMFFSRPPKP